MHVRLRTALVTVILPQLSLCDNDIVGLDFDTASPFATRFYHSYFHVLLPL